MSEVVAETREDKAVVITWQTVCRLEDIAPDTGICALFGEQQVAIFRERTSNALFAISNHDPIGGANVLSRGIMGSLGGKLVVAFPLYKQHFDLKTGECLEQSELSVASYAVRVSGGDVQLRRR